MIVNPQTSYLLDHHDFGFELFVSTQSLVRSLSYLCGAFKTRTHFYDGNVASSLPQKLCCYYNVLPCLHCVVLQYDYQNQAPQA